MKNLISMLREVLGGKGGNVGLDSEELLMLPTSLLSELESMIGLEGLTEAKHYKLTVKELIESYAVMRRI
ncbi:MAG: hypothetical protein P3X22_006095 [Thermoprotei archaeon]|nr:hypothetical protein [Thermoprotei archaeon]